jgi:hypothetical protein
MNRQRIGILLLPLLALIVLGPLAAPVRAQVLYGAIVGTVEDQTGALVLKASVVVTNKVTGATREVATDEAGRYAVLNVLPGRYDVRIGATGFKTVTRTDVEVTINTVTRADIRLEVGALTEQVTIEAAAVVLQTDKSDIRHEITGATVQNLPLPSYRNYQSLVALVPGATPPAFQNAVVDTPGRPPLVCEWDSDE